MPVPPAGRVRRSLRGFAALPRRLIGARRRRLGPQLVRSFPRQSRHEPTATRRRGGGGGGRWTGGGRWAGGRRGRLDDEAGRLLAA